MQPGTVSEMTRMIVNYCIGLYEAKPRRTRGTIEDQSGKALRNKANSGFGRFATNERMTGRPPFQGPEQPKGVVNNDNEKSEKQANHNHTIDHERMEATSIRQIFSNWINSLVSIPMPWKTISC